MELQKYLNDTNSLLICPLHGKSAKYSHNASKPFKSASVIKTFVLAYYLHSSEDFGRKIQLSKKGLIGSSFMTELRLTEATVKELLVYMMGSSDNSATNALLSDAGFDALNSFCKDVLGAKHTVIGRKMLDFEAEKRGEDNVTCLSDCLSAMRFILEFDEGRDIMCRHKERERILRYIYAPDIEYYGKCGSIPNVYNEIAVLRRPGGEYVFAGVLSHNGTTCSVKKLMGKAGLVALDADRPII